VRDFVKILVAVWKRFCPLSDLKPVMKIMDPIQVLLIFMQNMDLLLAKTPPEDVKSDVLPMLYRALGMLVTVGI
jgi:hypothetical protein